MENNKICPNCGKENGVDSNFCLGCGTPLKQNIPQNNQQQVQVANEEQEAIDKKEGDKFGIISLILFFAGSTIVGAISLLLPKTIGDIIASFGGLCPLAGIVTMIVGRIKYPKNTILKVSMWLIILLVAVVIIAFVILLMFCWGIRDIG